MRCACSRSQRYFGKLSHDELHPRQSEVAVSAFPLLYSVSDNIAPEIGQTTPSVALYRARYLKLQDCNTCEQPACWLTPKLCCDWSMQCRLAGDNFFSGQRTAGSLAVLISFSGSIPAELASIRDLTVLELSPRPKLRYSAWS